MPKSNKEFLMTQMHVILENIGKGGEEEYGQRVVKFVKAKYKVEPISRVTMTDGCYLIYYVDIGGLTKLHKYFRKKKQTKTIRINGELTRV
jgi:hypothetical protein